MNGQNELELSRTGWRAQPDVASIARQACADAISAATSSRSATPPATYFISVLELATGETLGNEERLRAIAMLEAHFAAGHPRTLKEAVRICAGAIDSSTLQRMARGAKA
jgi:hypothetical protein